MSEAIYTTTEAEVEVWADVVGYEGLYRISTHGRVLSLGAGQTWRSPRFLKPRKSLCYLFVSLHRKGCKPVQRYIHLLVLEAFVGPRPSGLEACHNDGDPFNNKRSNLRWDTHVSNCADRVKHGTSGRGRKSKCRGESHGMAKLTEEEVQLIKQLYATGKYRQVDLAIRFDVIQPHISRIIRGENWQPMATPGI